MSAPTISAAQAIGEYLQSPDDLAKIQAYRKKLEKEKASIDARLKNGVKEQILATRDGLRKLLSTRTNVQAIKDEMVTIDRECNDPQNAIATFDQISRVSMVHRNFEQTEEMVSNLLAMDSKLDMLEDMLEQDCQDILGPAPNLLVIHFVLNQLEAFRNQTMHQAKKASSDSRITLARYFERLVNFIEAFDEYITGLARNILSLVRANNQDVIVRLIKIAEVEGKEDEKAIAIRLVKKAAKMDAASKFKSMQANARIIKHYRSKIMRSISESITAKFEDAYAEFENDPQGFLQDLQWMYQDIIRVESDVVPCFPPEYEIYSHYIRNYHKALNSSLKKLIASEPGASVFLALYEWLKEYKKNMKELGVPPELLEPPLLDGKEQELIEDYLQVIIKKLDEWSANLMKTEIAEFVARKDPPELDADGLYGLQGTSIMFQMVNQQIDLATESGQGAILSRVVAETNRIMKSMQEQWLKAMEAEYKKQSEKPEEATVGLVDYVIALANDQLKCADFTEALLARLEPLVSEKYRVPMNERLNDAIDGNLDVARKCIGVLIDVIFLDLKPATKSLFGPSWYEGIMRQVVETIRDYMGDYQSFLNNTLFELLSEDLTETFLVAYITALANCPKLKMPAATDQIRDDIEEIYSFFGTIRKSKDLEVAFEIIEQILAMLEASKELVFLSFYAFAQKHGPNINFVEGLVKARSDLDRSAASEVIDSVKRKVKEENLTDPEEPTIMKKIAISNSFSRFLQR